MENNRIITATLANIYLEQGYLEKAIEIYEKLLKREPENNFFRQRLSSLKKDLKERHKMSPFKKILKKRLW
jgi:tetratricopeptide (TPR) repeat protein